MKPLKKQPKQQLEPAPQKTQNPALEGFLTKLQQHHFTEADAITTARYYYNQPDLEHLNAAQLNSLFQRVLDRAEKAEAPAPVPPVVVEAPALPEVLVAPPQEEPTVEAQAPIQEVLPEVPSGPVAEEPKESPESEPEMVPEAAETKEEEKAPATQPEELTVVESVAVVEAAPEPEIPSQESPPPAPVVEAIAAKEEPTPGVNTNRRARSKRETINRASERAHPGRGVPDPATPEIMEDRYWRKNGWSAKVIKNEDDDGWAIEIHKEGVSEPVLVSPWVMGRDKKNPKPFDAPSFATFVKTASEVIRRAEQQRERALKKMVSSCWEGIWYKIVLQIIPDEFDPYAILSATDPDGEIISKIRVAPNYKLTQNIADKWVRGGFKES